MHSSFLVAAYALVWVGVLLYVSGLARRHRALQREIDEVRRLLERPKA